MVRLTSVQLPVTQELLDDNPPGLIERAMYRAMNGTVVGGRWLRNLWAVEMLAVKGTRRYRRNLNSLRTVRRGVTGQAAEPDPGLQQRWGLRTTVSYYMAHHGLTFVTRWYTENIVDPWPPAVMRVPRD